MIEPKTREALECDIGLLAAKYQDLDLEDVLELVKLCWSFESDISEHFMRGNIRKSG